MTNSVGINNFARKSTYEFLIEQHGPLMKIEEVAKLFHKSTDAIRITLSRDSDLSRSLRSASNRYGRRIYFLTEKIADIVDNGIEREGEDV